MQKALVLFQRHSIRLESRIGRLLRHLFARGLQSVQALLNRLNQFLTGRRFLIRRERDRWPQGRFSMVWS
jgi:hypothetical protein